MAQTYLMCLLLLISVLVTSTNAVAAVARLPSLTFIIDLSSTFDTVDHDTLLTVLRQQFGFGAVVLD